MFRRLKFYLLRKFSARHRAALRWSALARHDEQGQSAVEMALCLPIMLLVVTGITTFGIAMNNYLLLTESTNSGARIVALSRGQTSDPCQLMSNTVSAAAPLLKATNITYDLAITPANSSTTTHYPGTSPGTSCPSAAAALTANATATVTVNYPCSLQVYGRNLAAGCNMQAMDAELVQ